jgi:hypothetical protein
MDHQETKYTCNRCHYTTDVVSSFKRHLTRKTPCKATFSNKEPSTILKEFQEKRENEKTYKCKFCDKTFKYRQSRYLHQKQHDSENIVSQVTQRVMATLGKPFVVNNITNNTHIEANNNIQLNAFGKENLDHITKPFLDQCVKRRDKGLLELVHKMHFDENAPENSNIKITNKKMPFIQYHNGNKWMLEKKDKVLNEVIDKSHWMMQEHFDDHEHEYRETRYLSENMINYVREWLEKVSDKERDIYSELLTDVYLLIYNATN